MISHEIDGHVYFILSHEIIISNGIIPGEIDEHVYLIISRGIMIPHEID